MRKHGFDVICDIKTKRDSNIARRQLAGRFSRISDDDLTTSGAFIQAVKR